MIGNLITLQPKICCCHKSCCSYPPTFGIVVIPLLTLAGFVIDQQGCLCSIIFKSIEFRFDSLVFLQFPFKILKFIECLLQRVHLKFYDVFRTLFDNAFYTIFRCGFRLPLQEFIQPLVKIPPECTSESVS